MTFAACTPGDSLETLEIPVDRASITAGAIASQDFEDVHRDPDAAQRRGAADIFISINTTNGLIDRYITDWTGPTGRLVSVGLRLGMPLHPGDVLRMDADVEAVEDGVVTLQVVGRHERGTHVTAKVKVRQHESIQHEGAQR